MVVCDFSNSATLSRKRLFSNTSVSDTNRHFKQVFLCFEIFDRLCHLPQVVWILSVIQFFFRRVLHKSSTLKGSRRYDDDPHTSRSNFPRYSAMSHHNTDRGGNAQSISASISGVYMCAKNFFRDFFSMYTIMLLHKTYARLSVRT